MRRDIVPSWQKIPHSREFAIYHQTITQYTKENLLQEAGSLFLYQNEETLCNSRMRGNMEDFQDFQIIDNCLMVRMPEEVDHHRASYICEGADRLLVRENVENVVFDFEDTRFMDSSGIGIIMGRYRKISCFGGHVYAIHTDRQIQRIFRMSGLHKIVEILPG